MFGLLQLSAWTFRLPAPAAAAMPKLTDRDAASGDAPLPTEAASPAHILSASGTADISLAAAQRLPHFYLIGLGTFCLCTAGLPFMSAGSMMVSDIFPPDDAAGTPSATVFPAVVASANMCGRLLWGPVSDAIGRAKTYGILSLSVPSLMLLPLSTSMVATDPHAAFTYFKSASFANVLFFAGAPVMLAPVVGDLFGRKEATGIYQRLAATIVLASPLGAALVTKCRDSSYLQHATRIAHECDPYEFSATFGGEVGDIARLVDAKAVTLPLLMRIAPPGTVDPTPLLYNDAFYLLAGSSGLATACFAAAFRPSLRKMSGKTS